MTDDTHDISRRDAVKLLAALPLAGALRWTPAELDRALRLAPLPPAPDAPFTPRFFTPHEYATVRVLSDLVIPRDERSGSATDAGVPEFMDFMMHDAQEATRTAMRGGLAWIDAECSRRWGRTFVGCDHSRRVALLDDIAWPARTRPELAQGAAFFSSFRDLTASGFWTTAAGYRDLQYQGEVFDPGWNGCPQAALNKLGVSYETYEARIARERAARNVPGARSRP